MTEPTPACVKTTRALRIVSTMHSKGMNSTSSACAGAIGDEWPCWITNSSSIGSSATARRSRSKRASFVPTRDEDHVPAEKRLPTNRDPRQPLRELGPLHVAPVGDGRNQPVAEGGPSIRARLST